MTENLSCPRAEEPTYLAWRAALGGALGVLADPEQLESLLGRTLATFHSVHRNPGPLSEMWTDLFDMMRLLDDHRGGLYTDVPRESLALMVASFRYFVSPFDAIPDFIPRFGLVDDARVFRHVLCHVHAEIASYREWTARAVADGRR